MLQHHVIATNAGDVDTQALERELRGAISGEVRFGIGDRALYATDSSNYRQTPIGVVIPRTVEDVVATVAVCRRHNTPVLSRGGGTSLCGQCCNVAVIMDFSKYLNRILEIDVDGKWARVQPGVVLDDLRNMANQYDLTFAPDPATHTHNTLGGMLGNNSCGPHSVLGGETMHNIIELDVLLYDGTRMTVGATDDAQYAEVVRSGGRKAAIFQRLRELVDTHADEIRARFPAIPRRVSGFNLPALLPERGFNIAQALVGTEGTCVVILEARVRLVEWPRARSLLVLGYPSVYEAADHVIEVLDAGPIAIEGIDDRLVDDMKKMRIHPEDLQLLPGGGGWLLVEFGGADKNESDRRARMLMQRLNSADSPPSMKLYDDPEVEAHVWKIRESGLGATAHVPDKPITWEGWEDSSVPPERLGEYLRKLRALFEKYGYGCDLYGHFGQGCVHTRIDFDLETASGITTYREFLHEAARLVSQLGGSISGEHGDGQSKAELLPIMYGERIVQAFGQFKAIWDPDGKMNPGKVVNPYSVTENLRLGPGYNPPPQDTAFAYSSDHGDFNRAMLRCVGVGNCRGRAGTMCPSYQATGEEKHSTRGRARLLFEMIAGDTLTKRWQEPAVKEALDLCLSCKGCKSECPVNVDMATYRAEFLYRWYQRHPRPPAAWLFGLIDRWASIAGHAPEFVNFFSQHRPIANLAKRLVGVAPQRQLPQFHRPFTADFHAREKTRGAQPVILWPDTFNNFFHPDVVSDAAVVLERAGFDVRIPRTHLCCGRPLYEFGMLDRARDYLLRIMDTLADDIAQSVPIVVLEPACASVFKVELTELLPHSRQAHRLSQQVFLLSEFVERNSLAFVFKGMHQQALVHGHCHEKSIFGMQSLQSVLQRIEVAARMPDTGCCGMAGSFGFEKSKYDVSMRCGERALLPAVRDSDDETLVIATGYSCREQIEHATGRRALHPAQVMKMALS